MSREDAVGLTQATDACSGLGQNVTFPMVDFLNITKNFDYYFQAYCTRFRNDRRPRAHDRTGLNPQSDDSCSFGYCPQPDVAGMSCVA
jgi:hypothetical protein